MTASAILARAEAAGLTVEAAGDRLWLSAPERPSDALLHELAGAKAELLALLQVNAHRTTQAEPSAHRQVTPERAMLDQAQRELLAGLITASRIPTSNNRAAEGKVAAPTGATEDA